MNSTKIGFSELGTAPSAEFLGLLPGRLRDMYNKKLFLQKHDHETVKKIKKCLIFKSFRYVHLIFRLEKLGIIDIVRKVYIEINGLFIVPKEGTEDRHSSKT